MRAFLWRCCGYIPFLSLMCAVPFIWDFLSYHVSAPPRPGLGQQATLEFREHPRIPCALGPQGYDPSLVRLPESDLRRLADEKVLIMLSRGTRVKVQRSIPVSNLSDPGARDVREVRVLNGPKRGLVVYVNLEWLWTLSRPAHSCILLY